MTDLQSITNVCRICLNAPENSQLLFLNSTIIEKLNFVCGSIDECDGDMRLPEYICGVCDGELEFVYNFMLKIKLSKLRIKSLHQSAEHKEDNHDDNIQPFIKTEQIDSDFIDEFRIAEDVQMEGAQNDMNDEDKAQITLITSNYIIDQDELQTSPPIESNVIVNQDKIQISSVESNWIDRSSIKLEASPIESKCPVDPPKLNLMTSERDTPLENSNACHICNKTYSTRANLFRHIREHQGRRFDCSFENCKSFFTQRSSLKLHIATHTGEKPFLCHLCNKRFTQHKSLTLHLRIHSGDKPYSCDDCNKCFNQKSNLIRHFQSECKNAKPKRFQCVYCQKYYSSKQSLHRHCVQIHDRENEAIAISPPKVKSEVKPIQKLKIISNRFIITPE